MHTPAAGTAPPAIPDHRLQRIIGRGSYGEVWLAENIMGAGRAVKVVRRSTFDSARPYEREYSAIRRYEPVSRKADGLVQVLHAGRIDEEGLFYYVMELADSAPVDTGTAAEPVPAAYQPRTLASDLKRLGRLPVGDCVSIALSLAGALTSLHAAGLAHRDVKPSNIIFVNGRAKLADIGLVSELGDSRSFVGTEGYIPPEGPGTPSADLFSLGRVLYESVTGLEQSRYPELPEAWIAQDEEGAMEFFEVVLKACEGDPARRYQSGADMLADLALLQGGRSVRRVRLLEARVVTLKRWGLAALALAGVAAGAVAFAQWRAAEERALREQQAAQLFDQAIASARASVNSERPDARQSILNSARLAASARPGAREPRDAAIAALTRPGLVKMREFPDTSGRTDGGGGPAFSGDFQLMTEVDAERRVTVREVQTGNTVARLSEPLIERWFNLDFSPDAQWLSGQTAWDALQLWHLSEPRRSLPLQRPGCTWMLSSYAPDSTRIAVVWTDGMTTVHSLEDGRTLCEFRLMPPPAGGQAQFRPCGVWSPDGTRYAAGATFYEDGSGTIRQERGLIRVHDAATGAQLHSVDLDTGVDEIDWCPQGDWLALAMADNAIRRWEFTADRAQDWLQHDARAICVDFHPSGEWLVSSSWDSTTLIWNVTGQHPLARLNGWGTGSRFSANGSELLHHDAGRRLRSFYAFQTSGVCRQLTLLRPPGHNPGVSPLTDAAIHRSGLIAAGGYDGLWIHEPLSSPALRLPGLEAQCVRFTGDRIWCGTRNGLVVHPVPVPKGSQPAEPLTAAGRNIHHLDTTPDGLAAVMSTRESEVFLWKAQSLTPLPGGNGFAHVAISPDGRLAAGGGRADLTRLWRLEGAMEYQDIHGFGAWVHVVFSPDSRLLLTGDGSSLRAFDVPGGTLRWTIPHMDAGGFSVRPAFSPQGGLIAATLEMRQPWLIDAATGSLLARLEHPFAQGVNQLAFSPGGRTLAALGTRHSIFLWDLTTLRAELKTLGLDW